MEPHSVAKLTAQQKVHEYYAELARRRLLTFLLSVLVMLVTVLLVMIFSGNRYDRYLNYFGLQGISNPAGGIYADCSKRENQNSPYCNSSKEMYEKKWNSLTRGGGAPPFSLIDKNQTP